jgi:hypothetical protein
MDNMKQNADYMRRSLALTETISMIFKKQQVFNN